MSIPDPGPLPPNPSLERLRKIAKELRASGRVPTLAAAQLALARGAGFSSWAKLKLHCEQVQLRRLLQARDHAGLGAVLAKSPRLAALPLKDEMFPLHVAVEENDPVAVELLMRAGASRRSKYGSSAHTALSWAVTCWSFAAAEQMVAMGEEPDLFCAAGMGRLDAVKAFWTSDGQVRRSPSRTGSSRYAEGKRLPCPPPDDRDQVSDALYIACRCGRLDVARWLLDHGADPNWRGYAGATCLAWAEFSGDALLCALLRERGGSDLLVDSLYRAVPRLFRPMLLAGWGFPAAKLAALLDADPALVHTRNDCCTLLHAAAEGGHVENVRLLLSRGADRTALNWKGQTALELAREKGHDAAIQILAGMDG